VAIQAVTFDVGGTLIRPWPSVGHVYAEVAARHGLKDVSPELLNERFKGAWRAAGNIDYSRAGWQRLVDETFRGLCAKPPSATFFPELYERFAQPDAWRIFDDVLPALDALASRGIRLGVISNWDERLRGLLRGLRLHDYFEVTAISCEMGFPKPSPVIFRRTAANFGLPPASILHVGDSLEMDVQGAESAGMPAVRIERDPALRKDEDMLSLAEIAAKIE